MSEAPLVSIKNLHANAGDTPILQGIDLELRAGEVHAIMGPNGSGKSTLSNVLVGKPGYEVTDGEVLFRGANLVEMDPEIRARARASSSRSSTPSRFRASPTTTSCARP